jgi:hypothetical protein
MDVQLVNSHKISIMRPWQEQWFDGNRARKKWHLDPIFPLNFWLKKNSVDDKIPNEQYDKDRNYSHQVYDDVPSQYRSFFEVTIIDYLKHTGRHIFQLQVWASMYLFLQHYDPRHVSARLGAVHELTFVYTFWRIWSLLTSGAVYIVTCFESASV